MGTAMSAEWWREYRRRNRERLSAQQARRRQERPRVRGDRSAEYAARSARRAKARADAAPLAPVHPHLHHGTALAFWDEELRVDMEQERALAVLEGRDPETAAVAYKAREKAGRRGTPLHLIPDHVLELAVPVTYLKQPVMPTLGPIHAKAVCHDAVVYAHGLCERCYRWARRQRTAVADGRLTEEDARRRVRERLPLLDCPGT